MQPLAIRSMMLVFAAAFAASIVLPAHAQPALNPRANAFPAGLAEARLVKEKAKELGVSEDTLAKVDALSKETRAQEEELRTRLREATQKVRKLLDENRPDEKALLETSALASKISRETRLLRLQCSLKVRALLSDEQLGKFMEIRKKAMSTRRARGRRPRG